MSDQAMAILKQTEALSRHLAFIFPGEYDQDKCISNHTINNALRLMATIQKSMSVVMVSGRWRAAHWLSQDCGPGMLLNVR